jgi:cytochrome c oxidase accessory protein FixG
VFFYALATYGNAGFLREQICRQMCPYARFQFAMFDPDTLIIAYDKERGDPRGSRARNSDYKAQGLGDCVDCGICVQVCPTGIDIRNGLQNECIGCAACIDACDQVMEKVGYAPGLIRYSTENAVAQKLDAKAILRRALRPRVLFYVAVFLSITSAVAWSLATRVPLKVDVIRDRAALAREAEDGSIENVYRLQVMNTSEKPRTFNISVTGLPGIHLAESKPLPVAGGEIGTVTASVRVEQGSSKPGSLPIAFQVRDSTDAAVAVTERAKFWMP